MLPLLIDDALVAEACRSCRASPADVSCGLCATEAVRLSDPSLLGNETRPVTDMDYEWLRELDAPDDRAVRAGESLQARASSIAAALGPAAAAALGEVDVVVSGGGNFDGYYLGVEMVLSRLEARAGGAFRRVRWAGVSAGGMMPFEIALKGEATTLAHHLAYGLLQEAHPIALDPAGLASAERQDHHWRLMADWQARRFAPALPRLNGAVFVGTSCIVLPRLRPSLLMISNYTDAKQAASAFMSTGTVFELYEGMPCSDGGSTSGARMTPLFLDDLRPQLTVSLLPDDHPSFPFVTVSKYNFTLMEALVRKGQDDAAAWLRCGPASAPCSTASLALCARGKATAAHVCDGSQSYS